MPRPISNNKTRLTIDSLNIAAVVVPSDLTCRMNVLIRGATRIVWKDKYQGSPRHLNLILVDRLVSDRVTVNAENPALRYFP